MNWAPSVGVDGQQRQAKTWVMMWAMMWAMGTMVAMTPVLVGKSTQNSAEFRDYSDSEPFELQIFHRDFSDRKMCSR
jgi:hypothetical protein